MDKKVKKTNSFMKNVLILGFSQILIKVLGLIYKLVITNIDGFGDMGLGYYSAGYQIYALLLTLSSIGIPSVLSKLVSERLAKGDKSGAQRIFKLSIYFFGTLGLIFSIGLFFGADFIATNFLNVPATAYVMKVLAPAIVFVSLSAVLRGYFLGQQNMKPSSISQTLEQFFNCILSITFVYACLGKDPYIMAAAGNLSTTVAIILAFIYLILYYKGNKIVPDKNQISPEHKKSNKQLLFIILSISIPITISSIIGVISSVIDTATVSNCIQIAFKDFGLTKEALEELAMTKQGIVSKIDTLITFPLAINTAFSTALVPAVAESIAKNDKKTAAKRLSFSIFASLLIILPCAMGFCILANPILKMIYPSASEGAFILQLSCITMIFTAINSVLNGGLYGLNSTKIPAIALGCGVVVKTILNIILISNPDINIIGTAIGSICCQLVAFFICYRATKSKIKLNLNFTKNVLKPIIATLIMGAFVYISYKFFGKYTGNTISTLLSIIVGVITYSGAIIFMKLLTKEELLMVPFGSKIYSILVKLGIYKEDLNENFEKSEEIK